MTLVVVLYLEQLIQKLKVFGGPFATFGSTRLCFGANPGGNSRKRVLSVCDELVSYFLVFATLSFSNFVDIISLVFEIFFFFLAACQQEVFSKVQRNSSCVGNSF